MLNNKANTLTSVYEIHTIQCMLSNSMHGDAQSTTIVEVKKKRVWPFQFHGTNCGVFSVFQRICFGVSWAFFFALFNSNKTLIHFFFENFGLFLFWFPFSFCFLFGVNFFGTTSFFASSSHPLSFWTPLPPDRNITTGGTKFSFPLITTGTVRK